MPKTIIITGAYADNKDKLQSSRFSPEEIKHIVISVIVLIFGFTFFFSNIMQNFRSEEFLPIFILNLIIASVAVPTEFLLHELAHKFTAQKYGCWSEYRYSEWGLIITLISGLAGFLIAAPGVVWHSGYITKKEEGKISAAGPATNLALGGIFIALWLFLPFGGFLTYLFMMVALINIWVGAFNMIPISPFDGSKIARWNLGVYVLILVSFILLGVGLYTLHPISL